MQELIAPSSLQFFDTSWARIGSRKDFSNTISMVTKIPVDVLTHQKRPSQYCIADRMSWAATRKTSRIEDRAYSLLGLFNVSMPTLYGEGCRAFRRLQEEILKTSDDMTFLLSTENLDGTVSALGSWVDSYNISYQFDQDTHMTYRHSQSEHFLAHDVLSMSRQAEKEPEPFVLTNAGVIISLTLLPWSANTFLAPVARKHTFSRLDVIDFHCVVLEFADETSARTMQRTFNRDGASIVNLRSFPWRFEHDRKDWPIAAQNDMRL